MPHHARIAKRIGLHAFEIKELGDTFVVGAQQLCVDLRADARVLADGLEARLGEELDGERQAEQPRARRVRVLAG